MDVSMMGDMRGGDTDRVRRSTPTHLKSEIDHRTERHIAAMRGAGADRIQARLAELEREWDVERVLELNAATLALAGLALGLTVDRRWLALPGVVLPFLLQHAVQGWCPPLPLLRRLGVRTQREIDAERYALMHVKQ